MVVNGLPGSGKTTLCAGLGAALGLPVLSKDAIKEALAEIVATPVPTSPLGAVASDTLWSLAALVQGPVIVESFWFSGRDDDYLSEGLGRAGLERGVEVWCEAPVDVVRARFRSRIATRHFAHDDASRQGDWESFIEGARPVSGFPVIRVDTSDHRSVDLPGLVAEIRAAIAGHETLRS